MRENASHFYLKLKCAVGIDWPKAHIVFLLCRKILRKVLQEGIFDAYNIEKISQDLMIKKGKIEINFNF